MPDKCTTADCPHSATTVVSVEDLGYYPYCAGCAEVLLRGGEHLHPSLDKSAFDEQEGRS